MVDNQGPDAEPERHIKRIVAFEDGFGRIEQRVVVDQLGPEPPRKGAPDRQLADSRHAVDVHDQRHLSPDALPPVAHDLLPLGDGLLPLTLLPYCLSAGPMLKSTAMVRFNQSRRQPWQSDSMFIWSE